MQLTYCNLSQNLSAVMSEEKGVEKVFHSVDAPPTQKELLNQLRIMWHISIESSPL